MFHYVLDYCLIVLRIENILWQNDAFFVSTLPAMFSNGYCSGVRCLWYRKMVNIDRFRSHVNANHSCFIVHGINRGRKRPSGNISFCLSSAHVRKLPGSRITLFWFSTVNRTDRQPPEKQTEIHVHVG